MMEYLLTFFNVQGLMPHGYCLIWNPLMLFTFIGADLLIFISYMIIPLVIYYVKNKRRDCGFSILYTSFFLFILLCGIGHLVDIIVLWYPMYGVQGVIKIAIAVVSMITAYFCYRLKDTLVKLESPQQLEERNTELNILSNKLTIANNNLEKDVQKRIYELKKVNDELITFSYIVSHDFREPLRAIRQFSEILHDRYKDELPKDAAKYVEIIQQGATKSTDLLDALTRFSTIGKKREEPVKLSIKYIIDAAIEELKDKIDKEKVSIEFSDNLPKIVGIKAHVSLLIFNLIDNAVKYSDKSKKKRFLKITYDSNSHTIYFIDNGIGIAEQSMDKCLEVFHKLNPEIEGQGMGLTICNKICLINHYKMTLSKNEYSGLTIGINIGETGDNKSEK